MGLQLAPNGLDCTADYLTIENLRASQTDYVTPGTIPDACSCDKWW